MEVIIAFFSALPLFTVQQNIVPFRKSQIYSTLLVVAIVLDRHQGFDSQSKYST